MTEEQHNQWQKNWPEYDLHLGYPIADADCVDKGKTEATATNHAYRKLGFLASDWQRAQKQLTPAEEKAKRVEAWLRKNDSTFHGGLY